MHKEYLHVEETRITDQTEDVDKVILFVSLSFHVFLYSCSLWYPPM